MSCDAIRTYYRRWDEHRASRIERTFEFGPSTGPSRQIRPGCRAAQAESRCRALHAIGMSVAGPGRPEARIPRQGRKGDRLAVVATCRDGRSAPAMHPARPGLPRCFLQAAPSCRPVAAVLSISDAHAGVQDRPAGAGVAAASITDGSHRDADIDGRGAVRRCGAIAIDSLMRGVTPGRCLPARPGELARVGRAWPRRNAVRPHPPARRHRDVLRRFRDRPPRPAADPRSFRPSVPFAARVVPPGVAFRPRPAPPPASNS